MYCKICNEYCGFNEDITCNNKNCKILMNLINKYGVNHIVESLKGHLIKKINKIDLNIT